MTTLAHPTAVIDDAAELAEDVVVGARCVIQGPVKIGAGTFLHPHVTIMGDTTMGRNNHLFPGAVIGAPPQDLKYGGERTKLVIGDRNHFREHVTVHPGTTQGGGVTRIGSNNLFMVGCHVAHDCTIGNNVVLSNHVLLAGHIIVKDGAIMNGASASHHFTTVGRLSYVGGLTRITQDVHPFTVVEGHPARIRAANVIGMQRAGFAPEDIELIKRTVYSIFISDKLSASDAIRRAEEKHGNNPHIVELIASIRAQQAGRQGRAAEAPREDRA